MSWVEKSRICAEHPWGARLVFRCERGTIDILDPYPNQRRVKCEIVTPFPGGRRFVLSASVARALRNLGPVQSMGIA